MSGYLDELEAEITRTRVRLSELEIALHVLKSLKVHSKPANEAILPAKSMAKMRQGVRRKNPPRVAQRVRALFIKTLQDAGRPMTSREMLDIMQPIMQAGDSTFWFTAKTLRNEGITSWDPDTRTHVLVSPTSMEKVY